MVSEAVILSDIPFCFIQSNEKKNFHFQTFKCCHHLAGLRKIQNWKWNELQFNRNVTGYVIGNFLKS